MQDLARADVTDPAVSVAGVQRSTAFRDLLTTLTAELTGDGSDTWSVTPALRPRGAKRLEADIVDAHRTHQAAVAARLGLRGTGARSDDPSGPGDLRAAGRGA